jgi:hypothetical protein
MFAEIIICMNIRKSAACNAYMAIPLLTKNFFCTDIIKIRGNIGSKDIILALGRPKCKQENIKWILQNYGVN